jgi:hypothetical protein
MALARKRPKEDERRSRRLEVTMVLIGIVIALSVGGWLLAYPPK